MFTIKKLKMWKDPKYTRQCVEVPPSGSWKLPAPDYTSTADLRPRRGSTLRSLELPLSYLKVFEMSYLYIEAEDGATTPNTIKIFGWITHVEEIASANEAVRIDWTPDYWRTYSALATYGAGTVSRCGDATYKRPFRTQPRKMLPGTSVPIFANDYMNFVICASTIVADEVTGFAYYYGQLDATGTGWRSPTTSELYSGVIDEVLGIVPSSIIGCWVMPYEVMNDWSNTFTNYEIVSHTYNGATIQYLKSTKLSDNPVKYTNNGNDISGLTDFGSDDMRTCCLVDPYGMVTSSIPWGFKFTSTKLKRVVDFSPEDLKVYIFDSALTLAEAMETGNYLTLHGLSVPVNSNAWSEYAFTYQRSYDKNVREIQRNQTAVAGYSSMGSSIVGGAIAGASKGNPVSAIGGAIGGGLVSGIGTAIGFFTEPIFNDKFQAETDKLVSNQTSNLLVPGGGPGWKALLGKWRIVMMEADTVSKAEYDNTVANEGYDCAYPATSTSAFITAGGPLQIQNQMITGNIPPEAKTYIKDILSNGVRIVENNPSGVSP